MMTCCGLAPVELVLAVGLAGGAVAAGEAQETDTSVSTWQHLFTVRASGGYKDNVLLSSELPDPSPFLGLGVEMIGWRPIGENGEFQGFLVGEHRQFLDATEVNQEQTLVTQASYRHLLGADWTVVMPAEYIYIDQVLDVSATQADVQATRVQGHTLGGRPAIRRRWDPGALELELAGLRQLYAPPLDDTWEMGTKVQWLQDFPGTTRADGYYEFRHVWYDEDLARTATGDPIPGTRRRMFGHEFGLLLRHEWGSERAWRIRGRLSGLYAADHVEGYFDYVRPTASIQLRYRRNGWLAQSRVRGRHYAYQEQVASETDFSPRRRSELYVELRGERELLPWLRIVAEYAYEQTFGNRPVEEYTVNTVNAGLEASF